MVSSFALFALGGPEHPSLEEDGTWASLSLGGFTTTVYHLGSACIGAGNKYWDIFQGDSPRGNIQYHRKQSQVTLIYTRRATSGTSVCILHPTENGPIRPSENRLSNCANRPAGRSVRSGVQAHLHLSMSEPSCCTLSLNPRKRRILLEQIHSRKLT